MRTLLCAVFSLLIMTLPAGAHALVLGEESLHSALDQPLQLELQLLDWEDVDLDRLQVGLASREDFEAFDLPYLPYMEDLTFTIDQPGGSRAPFVRVSGSRPMVEPYLNILVNARWPGGAVLREYIVLLDLPGESQGVSQAVSPEERRPDVQGQTGRQETARQSAQSGPASDSADRDSTSRPDDTPLPGPTDAATEPGREYYVVQPGDTLWRIAERFHPDGEVDNIYQTIISLHELNPDAFANTNITMMRANARLRIPRVDEVRRVDPALAGEAYESRLTQGQARVDALRRGEPLPEFTDFAVLGSDAIGGLPGEAPEPEEAPQADRLPGQEQPRPDDSGLRMASSEPVAVNPAPMEEATTEEEATADTPTPVEEQLRDELVLLETRVEERDKAVATLETEVETLTTQLEDAEDAVSRLTAALQRTRSEAAGSTQSQQSTDNRSSLYLGGLSGVLALLLLLAGAFLFRMKQRLDEQQEELDALTAADGIQSPGYAIPADEQAVPGEPDGYDEDVAMPYQPDWPDEDDEERRDEGIGFDAEDDYQEDSWFDQADWSDEDETGSDEQDDEDFLWSGNGDADESGEGQETLESDRLAHSAAGLGTEPPAGSIEEHDLSDYAVEVHDHMIDGSDVDTGDEPGAEIGQAADESDSGNSLFMRDAGRGSQISIEESGIGEASEQMSSRESELPEMFEFEIDKSDDDATSTSKTAEQDEDGFGEIESIDFNLDDLLLDLDEDGSAADSDNGSSATRDDDGLKPAHGDGESRN